VAGLEVELVVRRSLAFEHRAGGFGAGFLETIEQVAAALPSARIMLSPHCSGRWYVGAEALPALRLMLFATSSDAGRDRVRDQCDAWRRSICTPEDRAANLFGLSDEIVALVAISCQRAGIRTSLSLVGAFKRRDFIGTRVSSSPGARDGAFDAVRPLARLRADRLANVTIESLVGALRSEKRIATCAIDCAIIRNSWPRQGKARQE